MVCCKKYQGRYRLCRTCVGTYSLSEEEVKALGVEINSVQVNFEVGDQIQVNGTAMDGFIGIVQKINIEDGTVDVLVSMFGRDTQATLALNQVRRLDD